MRVEVDILGSLSLIVHMSSVYTKQQLRKKIQVFTHTHRHTQMTA